MVTNKECTYQAPKVEVVELKVEKGFALSTNQYNDDEMNYESIDDWM